MDYILTPDGKLMHCDLSGLNYIDLDEDEICHWKYVRKKKLPNGKWRYYYEDSELETREQIMNSARNNQLAAGYKKAAAKDKYDRAYSNNFYKNSRSSNAKKAELFKKEQTAKKEYEKASAERDRAASKYERAKKDYKKEKVKDLPRKLINKGVVYIANLLNR